jgi:hypothetical protein
MSFLVSSPQQVPLMRAYAIPDYKVAMYGVYMRFHLLNRMIDIQRNMCMIGEGT